MLRNRLFNPKNILILSIVLTFCGLIWMANQCSKDSLYTSDMVKRVAFVHQSLEQRERFLLEKEREIDKKLKLLGITKFDNTDTKFNNQIPTIFFITPTYQRLTQKADLTRLSQTLLHVPKLHWILVEDSHQKTDLVQRFLASCGVQYTHLAVRTPKELITKETDPRWLKARGVEQRNLGLNWIRQNFKDGMKGVIYFGDDDNTYDLKIFEQMRYTKKISVWPVGLVGGLKWEGPICKDGSVVKFYTLWKPERPMPLDMAGFAINAKLIIDNPDVEMDTMASRGYLESSVVGRLATREEFEPLADNCKQILVWHTQTANPKMKQEDRLKKVGLQSDPSLEV
ncbi:galactosylgalactosylxylosylprotein 3-beta-glucuronosyltransferase 3-like [Montipora capricornis]|uniref:galactosylgalactosylxylosylprotein 3-beta-glucuronosyltransferase 3-like n=1 Tax=Montipora capricornis TaxID=246305 RepID=UPI0035F14389